jgi:AcrR family transcriptional regulator
MTNSALTSEQILVAAEDFLRRFGPTKATVVDVTRALGASHGSVDWHFASKAALRDAVTEGWLARISAPLAAVAAEGGLAPACLRRWLNLLITAKRSRAWTTPSCLRHNGTRGRGACSGSGPRGCAGRAFGPDHRRRSCARRVRRLGPAATARAVFDAAARFHNPVHAAGWAEPNIDAACEGVWSIVLAGLGGRRASV